MDATQPLHEAILQIYNITSGFATPDQEDFVTSNIADFPIQSLHDSDRLPTVRTDDLTALISIFQKSYEAESRILIANNLSSKISTLYGVYEDMMMDSFKELYLKEQIVEGNDSFMSTYDVSKYIFDSSSMYMFDEYSLDNDIGQMSVDETVLSDQTENVAVSSDSSLMNDSDTVADVKNSDKKKKQPIHFAEAKTLLEEVFKIKKFPNSTERNALASKTGLTQKQIRVWFTNKRCRSLKS